MAAPADDKHASNRYDKTTPSNSPADPIARIPRQRRRPAPTITDVRVARIETVTMTPAEETEAIEALAVLIARYWREHPDQAA
jgi:hypothetical protein